MRLETSWTNPQNLKFTGKISENQQKEAADHGITIGIARGTRRCVLWSCLQVLKRFIKLNNCCKLSSKEADSVISCVKKSLIASIAAMAASVSLDEPLA